MRRQKMRDYRRQKVDELLVKGATQNDIASVLRISQSTVSRDLEHREIEDTHSGKDSSYTSGLYERH